MHGQHVAVVVAGQVSLPLDPAAKPVIIDDVVRADQPRQAEGLGGGIEGHGALPASRETDWVGMWVYPGIMRSDQISSEMTVQSLAAYTSMAFSSSQRSPYPAAGVVRGAQDGHVDVAFLQLPVHVRIVHAPDALRVLRQRRVDDGTAQPLQGVGEAHIGGAVDQNRLAGAGQGLDHGADAAQDPVFIPDVPPLQAGYPVPRLLPADDAVKVGAAQLKIPEIRVVQPGGWPPAPAARWGKLMSATHMGIREKPSLGSTPS